MVENNSKKLLFTSYILSVKLNIDTFETSGFLLQGILVDKLKLGVGGGIMKQREKNLWLVIFILLVFVFILLLK